MTKDKSAAVVTIHRAPDMTNGGRKRIADWLRRQARLLEKHGRELSETKFTARYMYR